MWDIHLWWMSWKCKQFQVHSGVPCYLPMYATEIYMCMSLHTCMHRWTIAYTVDLYICLCITIIYSLSAVHGLNTAVLKLCEYLYGVNKLSFFALYIFFVISIPTHSSECLCIAMMPACSHESNWRLDSITVRKYWLYKRLPVPGMVLLQKYSLASISTI